MTKSIVLALLLGLSVAQAADRISGEYVVRLKPTVRVASSLMSSLKADVRETISQERNTILIKDRASRSEKQFLSLMKKQSFVEYAEPNFIYKADALPDDPRLDELWSLRNFGQPDAKGQVGVSGVDVGMEAAWNITTGSEDVIVAVIDTGTQPMHEELKNNIWVNQDELNGKPGVDDDGNGYVDDVHGYDFVNNDGDPTDDHGHGSHVSGTIGAEGNNKKDIVGVNWKVKVMGLKFLSAGGSGSLANAVKAIDYATKMKARIMSNSWGGGGFSQAMKDSIDAANKANVLFVAAAGNESANNDTDPHYPASYKADNVVSVAAIDNRGQMASFSCFGPKSVHVAAPGVNILSLTTNGYEAWSGTSMATPHVSGIAALLLSKEPTLTAVEIKERLMKTVVPLSSLRGKIASSGLVNAYNALTNTVAPPDPEDPANWPKEAYALSSVHPYELNKTYTFEVRRPGAKKIAVHFSKFETEKSPGNGVYYDYVKFYDSQGVELGMMDGNNDDTLSPVANGESITIKLTSDDTEARYGFDIDKIAFQQ